MLGYSQKTDGGCHLCILPVVLQSTISPRGGAFTYIWHPGLCSRYPGDTSRSSGSGDQGSCTSGYHVTIRETADCHPSAHTHCATADWNTSPVWLWKGPICSSSFGLRGRLLVGHPPRGLQRWSQKTQAGDAIITLSPSASLQLTRKNLYPCLVHWFLWILLAYTSTLLGSDSQQGFHSQNHRTVTNRERVLKQLPPPRNSKCNEPRGSVFLWKRPISSS